MPQRAAPRDDDIARFPRKSLFALALAGLLALGIGAITLLGDDDAGPREKRRRGPPPLGQHRNERGRYAFAYPAGWQIRDHGSATTVTSPDGNVVISLGRGARGTLRESSESLLESLDATYDSLRVTSLRRARIGPRLAFVSGGAAVNDAGVRIRFVALVMRARGRNWAVTAFAPHDTPAARIVRSLEPIVRSFRVLSRTR